MGRHTSTCNPWASVLLAVLGVLAVWGRMNGHRAWEANRTILPGAKNCLEPELRNDKSGFFKDLEGGLLDSEMKQGKVEGGFLANLCEHLRGSWSARA